ncbi:MAG: 16S rRNA (adenine(1518)-N(6)/adenine(1519)-N(6))-dimethyltransferase RsmA [Acidiferrobacterales bacterium]|nr:16S rRNA (adenine(1518)-N(6)/adenine(1519)-N(6))-dimethyltransferase RsmA [Acidiferrobacterales bacterium]
MSAPRPKKRFGQHFLHDRAVVARIVSAFRPQSTDHVAEIGPGPGVLTRELAHRVGRFDAVEIDRDLAAALTTEFAAQSSVTIHEVDALAFDFCSLTEADETLRLIGNLPYNISTPLLFHLFAQHRCIHDMLFMLQKEVVDRLCAVPGNKDYGRLSVMAQWQCRIERCFNVGPGAFTPPPKVDSAVVRLVPIDKPISVTDTDHFAHVVKAAFAQRRKTLRNSLREIMDADAIRAAGVDPVRRPETLTVAEFAALANASG